MMNEKEELKLLERMRETILESNPDAKIEIRRVDTDEIVDLKSLPEVDSPSIMSKIPPTKLDSEDQLKLVEAAQARARDFQAGLPPAMVKAAKAGFNKMIANVYRQGQYSGAMMGSAATAVVFTAAAYIARAYGY